MSRAFRSLLLTLAATTLACAAETDPLDPASSDCVGGKCDALNGDDEPLSLECDSVLFDRSGRGFLPARLGKDALVKLLYLKEDDGCPVAMDEIMAVLDGKDNDCTKGLQTRVITEQAQLSGTSKGSGYRAVTTRTCGGRDEFGLVFSMFGFADAPGVPTSLTPQGDGFPDGLEIAAFDEDNGVFNYYKEVGGKMGFFGSSTDFVSEGPGGPSVTSVRGCANCHTGGGLIMKELTSPWLHWEGAFDSPGAKELVENRSDVMGTKTSGPNMQLSVVQPGNKAWNERKVKFLREQGTVAQMLEPLFCPVQVNIAAFNRKDRIGARFLVDAQLTKLVGLSTTRTNVTLKGDDYDAYTAAIGQFVDGTDKSDVVAPWSFVERSQEDADYVAQLVAADIIDEEFVQDVLMVDFTRPLLSDDRCDLLSFAPDLDPAERDPDAIREGFLSKLGQASDGSAAAQLRDHLQAHVDGARFDHESTLTDFIGACRDRAKNDQFATTDQELESLLDVNELHIDALKLRSLQRKIVYVDGEVDSLRGSAQHPRSVFEFGDTLPADKLKVRTSAKASDPLAVHPDARLSPVDCSLVTEFVSAGQAPASDSGSDSGSGGGTGDNGDTSACPGACGEFVNGASCQCDPKCAQFGNCCDGFEAVLNACPGDVGEFVNGASCQCDSNCTQFGNCCEGFEAVCG